MSQIERWQGALGDSYVDRNLATDEEIAALTRAWAGVLAHVYPAPDSVLEVGCNVGNNLVALRRLLAADLRGVEPNAKALEVAVSRLGPDCAVAGTLDDIPHGDSSIDLVFTSGVLIHVPSERLDRAYRELHRVARRWLLSVEYFSPREETVPWREQPDMLWKRDYGAPWLDLFDDLEAVAQGFWWSRTTGLDDPTWWLFRKR